MTIFPYTKLQRARLAPADKQAEDTAFQSHRSSLSFALHLTRQYLKTFQSKKKYCGLWCRIGRTSFVFVFIVGRLQYVKSRTSIACCDIELQSLHSCAIPCCTTVRTFVSPLGDHRSIFPAMCKKKRIPRNKKWKRLQSSCPR